ncbi:MAG: Gfo/Idh/MocA family protein [Candidatus Brocadiia bacterium]
MAKLQVGFIGTGRKPQRPGPMGYAMAYQHAQAFAQLESCQMVACADIVAENAEAFAQATGIERTYLDYREMLAAERLDVVSICTWPKLHAQMAIDCAQAGVRACHCEKPMALTYGGSRTMLQVAAQHGMQLTFNHQRRYGKPFRKAKELLDAGEIGGLLRMEAAIGDLYDGGTHWVDMLNYFNDEHPPQWVIGQVDGRTERRVFGAPVESQGICHVKYRNGVFGLFVTGGECRAALGVPFRLHGTEGVVEIAWDPKPGPMLRTWKEGQADWTAVDCEGEHLHGPGYIERAVADAVACLLEGRECELCARHAMNATEIIFACYESSRRRGRVDCPLDIDDNPLESMIARGDVPWAPAG